jgi:hypothetical protein
MATSKHREKQVEERLCKRAREHGGIGYKFTSPGRRSVPDRLMIVPCWQWTGCTHFVEAKAPGQLPTDSQAREHERLRALGCLVDTVDDYEPIDKLFEAMCDGSCNAVDA